MHLRARSILKEAEHELWGWESSCWDIWQAGPLQELTIFTAAQDESALNGMRGGGYRSPPAMKLIKADFPLIHAVDYYY